MENEGPSRITATSNNGTNSSFTGNEVMVQRKNVVEQERIISLIVELRGEMGNQLSVLAGARLTKLLIEDEIPNVQVHLIGQHQNHTKWNRGRDDLTRCFNALSDFNFEGGVWDSTNIFHHIQRIQQEWLLDKEKLLENVHSQEQIHFLRQLLNQQKHHNNNIDSTAIKSRMNSNMYSLPYLKATSFVTFQVLRNERYYNDIRSWLIWNDTACCQQIPDATRDEIVFHFRNFQTELGSNNPRSKNFPFVELSPQQAVLQDFLIRDNNNNNNNNPLTNNLTMTNDITNSKNNNLVLISRFTDNLQPYVTAFEAKGWNVRIIKGQSGVEDFCFLKKVSKTLFGPMGSTYTRWASILGQSRNVHLYRITQRNDNPSEGKQKLTVNVQTIQNRTFRFEKILQINSYRMGTSRQRKDFADLNKQRGMVTNEETKRIVQ